ncbi:LIM and calponin homology domains-containing protein 1 [Toxocara canis]|uniref:LIM and calponin homology domains-containing protein 1 n=1 Tax=Toxocara canis TaxID=6265 RepID=A0A0B2VZ27_TOXCA|nr:LIM and calponin homology domains-containing protein 1 [Toxocara canis]
MIIQCHYNRMTHEFKEIYRLLGKTGQIRIGCGKDCHAVESVVSPYATMEKKRRGIESISFDEKRSMFDRKSETKDSFMQFRQQRRHQQTSKWSSACGNANKHSGRGGNVGKNVAIQQLVNKFDAITNCVKYGLSPDDSTSRATSARSPSLSPYEDDSNEVESSTRERFNTFGSFGSSTDSAIFESSLQFGSPLNSMRSSPRSNADYRVISMDDKPEPGKLTDFVPEVERAAVIVDQASDNHQEEYKHRETEHDSRCVVSSLSQTDDSQPKLVRNYDITPCRSSAASPSQQNVIDFTKRAEEMTYIPLAKKPPPVPQKPRPPLPPSSALPPEEDEENDDDTQPGRAFVRKQLRQQIGLPQQNDDVYESEHRTMHSASQSGTERGVASAEKLPTIAGIRNLAAAESTNGVRREGDHMLEAQSRVNEHFIQLTSCSWPQSAASSFSGREHRNEPTSAESRNSMIRSQQRGTAAAYPDGDKRVTFGWSETHEITPRQTQEVVVPIVGPPPAQEVYQETTDDANTSSYETVARYGSKPSSNESLHPVEIIHPIHLSNQPNPEKRIFISTADQREQNNATVQRAREKKIWHSGRIPINPKLASSHVVQVRCSSCNSLLDEDALFQQNLDDDSLHVKQFSDESSLSAKPPSSISSDNLRGSEGRRVRCPNSYESVTERFYNSDVHTKYYVSRSLSPQRAKVTVNYETCNRPIAQGLCTSPELLEATDSREWRQIIEQQRLPNAADTNSKNRIDADSKFRIVHSSAGSLKDSLLSSSSWSPSTRSLPPTGIIDASRLNKAGMSGSDSRTPTNATSVLRASVEILHRFPDQLQHQSTESDRPSEFSSYKSGQEQCSSDAKSSEPVVAVSGKHKCSHCQMELGRGAAMIIESLNLFYHLSCFRCYVCNTSLGNGTQGADVRVRDSKLHCQSCYSNDEAGLKFSQV